MDNLVIIGPGGSGREIYYIAQNSVGYGESFTIKGFLSGDHPIKEPEKALLPAPLLGSTEDYFPTEQDVFICAIGDPCNREKLSESMLNKGAKFITLIHKTALVFPAAKIGIGCIVAPYVFISCNSDIHDFVYVNVGTQIGHDVCVEKYTTISGNCSINGNVNIGSSVFIGTGSSVALGLSISDNAYIGIGSVVVNNIKEGKRVFGNPAKSFHI